MKLIIFCILMGMFLCACENEYEQSETIHTELGYETVAEIENETEIEYDPDKIIDIFQDVEDYLVFDGRNGDGYASVYFPDGYCIEKDDYYFFHELVGGENNTLHLIHENETKGYIYFKCDDTRLEEGDTIHVYVKFYNNELRDYDNIQDYFARKGYFIPIVSANYSTPDLGEYIKDISEISRDYRKQIKEDIIEKCKEWDLTNIYEEYVINWSVFGYVKPTTVLITPKARNVLYAYVRCIDVDDDTQYEDVMYICSGYYIDKDGNMCTEREGAAVYYSNVNISDDYTYVDMPPLM